MPQVLVVLLMVTGFFGAASAMECETIILPSNSKGPNFYFTNEKIHTVSKEGVEEILFDDTHVCGVENTLSNSKLQHVLTDVSSNSEYSLDIEGKTWLVRENQSLSILANIFSLYYGKKETSSNIGAFTCGLDQIKKRLVLTNCE